MGAVGFPLKNEEFFTAQTGIASGVETLRVQEILQLADAVNQDAS